MKAASLGVALAAATMAGCHLSNPADSQHYEPSRLPVGELTLSVWLPAGLDEFRFDPQDQQLVAGLGINQIEWLQRAQVGEATAEEVAMAFCSETGIGMPVYYEAPGFTPYDKLRNWATRTDVEEGEFDAAVRERIAGLKQHWDAAAGFSGYLIGHEDYRRSYYEPLGRTVRALQEADPLRPAVAVGNIDSYPKVGRFLDALFAEGGAANVFQHEHYVFRADVPTSGRILQKRLDSLVAGYGRVARHLQDRHGRWHAIVQVQSETREGAGEGGLFYRKPTAGEISVQVGLALARGAAGIVYFLYSSGLEEVRDGEGTLVQERVYEGIVDGHGAPTDSYVAIKKLNARLAALSVILRDLHFHGGYAADELRDNKLIAASDGDLEFGFFGDGAVATHLLVVNRLCDRSREAALRLIPELATDAVAGTTLPRVGERTVVELDAGGFRLLELSSETPAAPSDR